MNAGASPDSFAPFGKDQDSLRRARDRGKGPHFRETARSSFRYPPRWPAGSIWPSEVGLSPAEDGVESGRSALRNLSKHRRWLGREAHPPSSSGTDSGPIAWRIV